MLAVAGCGSGGKLTPKELHQEAATVQSLAAEGGILAESAARGRSTKIFTREQAAFLHKAAAASATKLAQAPNGGTLALLAAAVRDNLDRLSRSGSDAALQRVISSKLEAAVRVAKGLGNP